MGCISYLRSFDGMKTNLDFYSIRTCFFKNEENAKQLKINANQRTPGANGRTTKLSHLLIKSPDEIKPVFSSVDLGLPNSVTSGRRNLRHTRGNPHE